MAFKSNRHPEVFVNYFCENTINCYDNYDRELLTFSQSDFDRVTYKT